MVAIQNQVFVDEGDLLIRPDMIRKNTGPPCRTGSAQRLVRYTEASQSRRFTNVVVCWRGWRCEARKEVDVGRAIQRVYEHGARTYARIRRRTVLASKMPTEPSLGFEQFWLAQAYTAVPRPEEHLVVCFDAALQARTNAADGVATGPARASECRLCFAASVQERLRRHSDSR